MTDLVEIGIAVNSAPVRTATQDLKGMASAGNQASTSVKNLTQSNNNLTASVNRSMRAQNQFGLVTQQVGYQVGDFLVQVQSGTNAFVAFGQQATQLAGLLYLIPTAAGAIAGTVASILIPTMTAALAYFSRTGEEAKTFADTLKDISNDVATFQKIESSLTESFVSPMNKATASLREYQRARRQTREEELRAGVRTALGEVLDPSISIQRELESRAGRRGRNRAVRGETQELEAQLEIVRQINETLAVATVGSVEELGFKLAEATNTLRDAGLLTDSMEKNLESLVVDTGLLEQAQESYNKQLEKSKELAEAIEERNASILQGRIEDAKVANKHLDEMNNEIKLLAVMLEFGAESVQVKNRIAAQEREAFEAMVLALRIQEEHRQELMDAYNAMVRLRKETEAYENSIARVASSAAVLAEKLGVSESVASRLLGGGYQPSSGVIFDPRDPNYDPIAAEMERIRLETLKKSKDKKDPVERAKRVIDLSKELSVAEKERLELLDNIENSLESGFMSMVDGTKSVKDAFRSMARDIIAELYRVLVVQRIVGSIMGFIDPSPAMLAPGIPKPPPRPAGLGRASGGSIMPGGAYLVGEKGPEIIRPRHSGTVVPAHLSGQGGSGFTQNLTISVTGSDAANVRMEVAKMIPQITEATKAAVIDARRRGGQMKAAFG